MLRQQMPFYKKLGTALSLLCQQQNTDKYIIKHHNSRIGIKFLYNELCNYCTYTSRSTLVNDYSLDDRSRNQFFNQLLSSLGSGE